MDVDALLEAARPRQKTITLYLKDLSGEIDDLEQQLEELQRPGRLNAPGARQVAEQIEALRQEMTSSGLTLRLQAMDRAAWRGLMAAHPPRRDGLGKVVDEDATGVNADSFYPQLARRSIVEPQLSDAQWTKLMSVLSSRQFDDLWSAAWNLNRGEVDVPFSRAASRTLQTSEPE